MTQHYKIAVGIMQNQHVTITASTDAEAFHKARVAMDKRYEKQGRESPVGWDLTILSRSQP